MPRPTAVLFDIDGTLVDTTYLHAVSWWQAFRAQDLDAPMARIHRAIGMGADNIVDEVFGPGHGADTGRASAEHDRLFSQYWPTLRRLPGARELVLRCHGAGLQVVLASSAKADEVSRLRTVLDADDWITAATSSDDADSSKPAPDLVRAALTAVGVDAAGAVFVGDAVWDVRAAAKAGVRCVGVECGGTSAHELTEAGAVATYADPVALVEGFDASPLVAA